MSFDWLTDFQQELKKPQDYAQKTLAAYRLGIKAKGSIAGVRFVTSAQGCAASHEIDQDRVYHPDDVPHIPLPHCDRPDHCQCVYRPVMTYQKEEGDS
jgi:hypothetical protein